MMLHLLFSLFIFFLSFSTSHAFTDISPDDPDFHIFQHLQDVGIMRANSAGAFELHRPVSRAEALTIALRAGGIQIPKTFDGNTYFQDVDPNAWYAPIVARAVKTGVLRPHTPFFRPADPVTKAEFLAFLFRATRVNLKPFYSARFIAKDIPNESWFAPYFAYAKKYQIATLPPDNLYRPAKPLTRREVALMTYRQLRIFHGNENTKMLLELQSAIQQFLSYIKAGKTTEAESYVQEIIKLNNRIIRKHKDENVIASIALSKAMERLTDALRYMRYQNRLRAIENLHLAIKYTQKAQKASPKMAAFAQELAFVIRETLTKNFLSAATLAQQ